MVLLEGFWGTFPDWIQLVVTLATVIVGIYSYYTRQKITDLAKIVDKLEIHSKELSEQTKTLSKRLDLERKATILDRMPVFHKSYFETHSSEGYHELRLKNVGLDAFEIEVANARLKIVHSIEVIGKECKKDEK